MYLCSIVLFGLMTTSLNKYYYYYYYLTDGYDNLYTAILSEVRQSAIRVWLCVYVSHPCDFDLTLL